MKAYLIIEDDPMHEITDAANRLAADIQRRVQDGKTEPGRCLH